MASNNLFRTIDEDVFDDEEDTEISAYAKPTHSTREVIEMDSEITFRVPGRSKKAIKLSLAESTGINEGGQLFDSSVGSQSEFEEVVFYIVKGLFRVFLKKGLF